LEVFVDQLDEPILALPIDLKHALGLTNGRAWVGLTAATGRRFQTHAVLALQFCEGPQGCVRPMTYCQAFGCNPEYPSPRYEARTPEDDGNVSRADAELLVGVPPGRLPPLWLSQSAAGGLSGAEVQSEGQSEAGYGFSSLAERAEADRALAEPDGWRLMEERDDFDIPTQQEAASNYQYLRQ
jgi:hypothetical protein